MYKSKQAESFIGIMIGVFLISIVILGISNLLNYSGEIIRDYEDNTKITILKNNTKNIISTIDTSNILENEIFYIHDNSGSGSFVAYTGSANAGYKYINEYGQYLADPVNYDGAVYARQLWIEREDTSVWEQNQVIRASIRRLVKKDWI